ncbi:hypothetical protein PR048_014076 [Dryococelus australis]|uniref:Uncharacterized protein n=1 Tax=Dryococelus australis TaxID=614101 RepID=A0ABQ9HVL9_9NEOP|nr:hypothetical protein PR048_014076 [Dryococelus australis]
MEQKIKAADTLEESFILEIEKTLHLKIADAYPKQGSIHFLSFDYMQNLPLPHITSNVVFYSLQLWNNIFGVHNLGEDSATVYHYCEREGKKGPNEVTPILRDYINHNREDEINELVLTSDGCPSQNKNRTMMHFIYCLVHLLKLYDKVTYIFPVGGKKITISTELPVDWDSVICNAKKYPTPFSLRIIIYDDFKYMKAATDPFFLKTLQVTLQLKETRVVQEVKGESTLSIKNTYSGQWTTHIVRSRQPLVPYLEIPAFYQCNPGIKHAKANDLAN